MYCVYSLIVLCLCLSGLLCKGTIYLVKYTVLVEKTTINIWWHCLFQSLHLLQSAILSELASLWHQFIQHPVHFLWCNLGFFTFGEFVTPSPTLLKKFGILQDNQKWIVCQKECWREYSVSRSFYIAVARPTKGHWWHSLFLQFRKSMCCRAWRTVMSRADWDWHIGLKVTSSPPSYDTSSLQFHKGLGWKPRNLWRSKGYGIDSN